METSCGPMMKSARKTACAPLTSEASERIRSAARKSGIPAARPRTSSRTKKRTLSR